MQEHCNLAYALTKRLCWLFKFWATELIPRTGLHVAKPIYDVAPVQLACFFVAMSAQNLCHVQLHVYKHVHRPQ